MIDTYKFFGPGLKLNLASTNDKRKTNPGSAEGSMIMDEVYLLTNDVPWLTSFNKKLLEND